ncbi:MAG TPA: hypothetical protein PLJ21_06925 [Pseudobdellovibrionaceae bacterium]|nr:hypothetical protein [Pseudobdellovibrionaceae bacterium]
MTGSRLFAPILINSQNRGELWIYPSDNEDQFYIESEKMILILSSFLSHEKLDHLRKKSQNSYLSMYSLQQIGLKVSFDDHQLILSITIPLSMVKSNSISINEQTTLGPHFKTLDPYSGYLNLYYTHTDLNDLARLELFQNLNHFVFESNASYSSSLPSFYRKETRLISDSESLQMRFTVGDLPYRTQSFQNYFPITGTSVKRQFSLDPKGTARTINSTQIEVNEPSTVEVFLNESLIYRKYLPIGIFDLRELPMYIGSNLIRIKLTNSVGQVQWIEKNIFFDSQILAKGVHEFSYSLGYLTLQNETEYSYDPTKSAISLFHNYGYSNSLNFGFNYQSLEDQSLMGIDMDTLFEYGTATVNFGYSYLKDSENSGRAFRFILKTFELIESPNLRLGFEAQRNDLEFTKPQEESSLFLGYEELQFLLGLTLDSHISLSQSYWHKGPTNADLQTGRFNFNQRINKEWRWGLSLESRSDQINSLYYFLSFSWSESAGRLSSHYQYDHLNSSHQLSLQRSNKGAPWDWSALGQIQSQEDNKTYDLQGERLTPWGNLRLYTHYIDTSQIQGWGLSTASSMAWSQGHVAFGKPINDGFLILSGKQIPKGTSVALGNEKQFDGPQGHLIFSQDSYILPHLNSYQPRTFRFISQQISNSYLMNEEFITVSPHYRQGGYYEFSFSHQLLLRGRLSLSEGTPLTFESGEIFDQNDKLISTDFFTNEQGEFVLLGLQSGEYVIKLNNPKFKNVFLTLPTTEADSIDLKEILVESK